MQLKSAMRACMDLAKHSEDMTKPNTPNPRPARRRTGVVVKSAPMTEAEFRALLALHRCLLRISELTARGIRL